MEFPPEALTIFLSAASAVVAILAANALNTRQNAINSKQTQESNSEIINTLEERLKAVEKERDEQNRRREDEIILLREEVKGLRDRLDQALTELSKAEGVITTYYKEQRRLTDLLSAKDQEIGRHMQSILILTQTGDTLAANLVECNKQVEMLQKRRSRKKVSNAQESQKEKEIEGKGRHAVLLETEKENGAIQN